MTTSTAVSLALVLLAMPAGGGSPALETQDAPDPLPGDPVFEATMADGSTVRGRIRSLSADGRLELAGEDGDARTVPAGEVVKLSRGIPPSSRVSPDGPVLVFPGGDQIRGQLDSADEREVVLRSSIVGELNVPLDAVLGFTVRAIPEKKAEARTIATLRSEPRTSDLLLLENGDRRLITFTGLTGGELSYLDSDRAMRLPRETVLAIGLDPGLVREPELEGTSLDLILDDGSRLRLLGASAAGARLSGQTTFGSEVQLPLDRVSDAYLLSDRVAYLSDLEATREVTVPYIGPARPARTDGSVLGGPLVVGGRTYVRSLGTQSRSLLAYRLEPNDLRFQARIALDDAAGPLGNVVFRVLVDGQERFASPPIAAGDEPMPVDVDLSGGRFLILATEFGRGGGVRDYAAWIEARLIRAPAEKDAGN
ncbi:NPCBM/NEW2 domain-containing protein [Tautonia sociabilis]|uniref:Carbohydrate-binding protein n=1 Tax=Tautonia sociabilis TaxID=2080755 RepID=A0A432MMI2_9BACT|nr:NPCBM/NEW2 domain-containing protein [Tautonia sociabilis]RUL88449.1 carbohydrate-binding protein [Tautonia sociabilis]